MCFNQFMETFSFVLYVLRCLVLVILLSPFDACLALYTVTISFIQGPLSPSMSK